MFIFRSLLLRLIPHSTHMFSIHTVIPKHPCPHNPVTLSFRVLQVSKNGPSRHMVPDDILSLASALFPKLGNHVSTVNILSIKLQQAGNESFILSVDIFSFLCLEKLNLRKHFILDHTFWRE